MCDSALPASSASAREKIIGLIEDKGQITFAEFMEIALYEPGSGYYAKETKTCSEATGLSDKTLTPRGKASGPWGKGERSNEAGDYVTSVDISPVFARTILRQLEEMWRVMGRPDEFTLVEVGAGRGLLSKEIFESARREFPEFFSSLRIKLVERNKDQLLGLIEGAEIYESLYDLDDIKEPITGCIFSNELIDALPFHRVVGSEDGLKEIFVGFSKADGAEGSFADIISEPSTEDLAEYFDEVSIKLLPGQITEVSLLAREWVKKAAALIDKGFLMTIDYGWPARELYSPERRGSLTCHYRHTINYEPYERIGTQDITAHADFTAMNIAGKSSGLLPLGITTQRNFLMSLGVLDMLREVSLREDGAEKDTASDIEAISFNQGIKELILPGGISDTMKVFIQDKGIRGREDTPSKLKGFSTRDFVDKL